MVRAAALAVLALLALAPPATASRVTRWLSDAEGSRVQLVRSYDLPANHPLADWAWTYDSAVAASAFIAEGDRAQARRLLDQLAALQGHDGSFALAFNVETGATSPHVRAGTVGWVGLAFLTYDRAFGDDRYAGAAQAAAGELLSLRRDDGLVRGGPDVSWASTEHNVVAYMLLSQLGDPAAGPLGAAIDSELVARGDGDAWMLQGAGDPGLAIDAQALGAMFLAGRGDVATAREVLDHAWRTFGRQDGFVPYVAPGAPDVLWFEGLAEMRAATATVGGDTSALDDAMDRWWAPTRAQGLPPRQASASSTGSRFGDFHPWPSAAAGAWVILARHGYPGSPGR